MSSVFSSLHNWFTFLGSCLAGFLILFQLREYVRKRASLGITLEQESFFSVRNTRHFAPRTTRIWFQADIQNTGSEPTTVSCVRLRCSVPELDGKCFTLLGHNVLRLEPHDRRRVKLFLSVSSCYLHKKIREINATIVFEVPRGGIRRKVTLPRVSATSDCALEFHEQFTAAIVANKMRG